VLIYSIFPPAATPKAQATRTILECGLELLLKPM
jgi:hypothetical protein